MSDLRTQLIWQLRACVAGHGNAVFNRADSAELLAMVFGPPHPHGPELSSDHISDLVESGTEVNKGRACERGFGPLKASTCARDEGHRGPHANDAFPLRSTYESDDAALAVLLDQIEDMKERHANELLQASRLDLALLALINNPQRNLSEGEKVLLAHVAVAYEIEWAVVSDRMAAASVASPQRSLFGDDDAPPVPNCMHGIPITSDATGVCTMCDESQAERRRIFAETHCEHKVPYEIDCEACDRIFWLDKAGNCVQGGIEWGYGGNWARRALFTEEQLIAMRNLSKNAT